MYIKLVKFINTLFMISACLVISACHFNSSYNNREVDKQDGEKVVSQFYELLKNKYYQKTYIYFDKRFFEVTDTQKLNKIYDISFEKLGDIESYSIERWETEAIVGTDPKINYQFLCNVKRTNYASKETITLLKEKGEIRIIGYHINSDGLFKK